MVNNKIKVKRIESNNNNLKFVLSIYDSDLPETTEEIRTISAVLDELGKIITPETTETVEINRPETIKFLYIHYNTPYDYIETQIKKEIEKFKIGKKDIKEKKEYFKNKVY